MTVPPAALISPALSEVTAGVCFLLILLVPLASAGIALINTGLGRSRSAAHSMMASLMAIAVAVLVYFIFGFSWQGLAGGSSHVFVVGGKAWNWIAAQPFFMRGVEFNGSYSSLVALLQLFTVSLAALIPLGAGVDRWRLGAICGSTALLAGLTYPIFTHWIWSDGWLAQLGTNYGLGHGFVDAGGSSSIHVVGGLTALSLAWILGPRRGKYSAEGMPAAVPGHNAVLVILGCLLATVGWCGLNSAGAILFIHAETARCALVTINTILAAASAGLTAAAITQVRFRKPDASLTANGWIGGLVASSAACVFVKPAAAVVIGIIAGALVTFAVEWFEFELKVDDPGGAISVHAIAGIWGILAVGLLARFPIESTFSGNLPGADSGQWLAQFIGIATLIGFVLPLTYGLNWLLNRFYPQRVSIDGERQGMDLHELGADAYPDFVTHADEFMQR
ncbi:MAG: ammonium transporter [Terriglobales bacterium]